MAADCSKLGSVDFFLQKGDADEKLLTKQDFPPVSYPARTPHPLPSFEIVTHNVEVEPQYSHGRPPLTTPDHAVEPAAIAANHLDKPKHSDAEEEQHHSRNTIYVVDQKRQDDDDDSAFSEEEEAATRIQQRFSSPLVTLLLPFSFQTTIEMENRRFFTLI